MTHANRVAALIGVGAVTLAACFATTAAPAAADPSSTPRVNDIVSVGNATFSTLMTQTSNDYNSQNPVPGNKFYSFDPRGTQYPVLKPNCFARARPYDSDSAILYLKYNDRPAYPSPYYCADIAGSARAKTSSDSGFSFVQFAQDAVTWSKTATASAPSNAPASLSNTELKAIYSCDASVLGAGATGAVHWNQVGGTSTDLVTPVLPPTSSETRRFFLSAVGVTTPGSCVSATIPEENEGTDATFKTNSKNLIFPYSVGNYLAQSQNGHGTGQQGNQVLGSGENGKTVIPPTVGSPGALTLNPQLTLVKLTHFLYNVVRDSGTSTHVPTYLQPLLGAANNTGYLCTNATAQADIQSYGFRLLGSYCGTVS